MFDRDPGGLLVVLVICHCVNAPEATMDTARSVKEDGREVNASVGCKAKGKSTRIILYNCLLLNGSPCVRH